MAEALYKYEGEMVDFTPAAAVVAGQVVQLLDGRAGVCPTAIAAGIKGSVCVNGIHEVLKTATMVMLPGSRLYWDHSANKAHLLHGNDKDFFLGYCVSDAASAATTVLVNLNATYHEQGLDRSWATVPVGTTMQTIGSGEGVILGLTATSEAQKVDALSLRGFATLAPCIVDALVCVNVNGTDSTVDFNVGLASATHATDADSIAQHMFAHIDGGALTIMLQSKDGTTTVTTVTSGVDAVVGTPFLVQFDLRDYADIQVYVNGVSAAPSSVFKLNAATGPLKVLAHMEKTTGTATGNVTVMRLAYRTFDSAT